MRGLFSIYSLEIRELYLDNKKEIGQTLMLFGICLSVAFLYGDMKLYEDNFNYAIEEMHAYDDELFQNNINIAGADWSPRLYANLIMAGMMKVFDIDWYTASMSLIRINYILYAVAMTVFVKKINSDIKILSGMAVTVCCMSGALISLGFELNGAMDVFLGTAIPLALIAMALVTGEKRNWNLAWIFLAVSEMMHVHEGIWAGCILGIIWIVDCFLSKKILWKNIKTIPVYISSVLMVVMPSLMGTEEVDNALFNEIYVYIRTPHHLLLSAWGMGKIFVSGMMLVGGVYILINENKKINKEISKEAIYISALFVLWIFLLVVEYFSTEVFAISVVVTMYVTKCFKYITWVAVLVYAKYGIENIEQKKYLQGLSLVGIMFFPYVKFEMRIACVVYTSLFLVYIFCDKYEVDSHIFVRQKNHKKHTSSMIILLVTAGCRLALSVGLKRAFLFIPIIGTVFFISCMKSKDKKGKLMQGAVCAGVIISIVGSSAGFIYSMNQGRFQLISAKKYVENAVGKDIYRLAKEFQCITDMDVTFLADPDSFESNGFQLISQRSCYALYKNIPSSKNSVIEWYERIENMRKVINQPVNELWDFMDEADIEYILVKENRFAELDKTKFFEVMAKNGTMGVYRLIR